MDESDDISELNDVSRAVPGSTALTAEQVADVCYRRLNFVEGDPDRIDALIASLG